MMPPQKRSGTRTAQRLCAIERSVAAYPALQIGQLVLQLDVGATIRAVRRHLHVDGHDAQRIFALSEIEQCGAVEIGRCELTLDHAVPFSRR
jgi:hypothetical protein